MLQSRSSPAGRVSLTVTACAVPGPALLTVMSKPMLSPALTGPTGLAVLGSDERRHWKATLAVDVAEPSLLAAPVAVLLTVAQSAWVVDEVMWTVRSLATPRLAKVQLSTWVPTGPVIAQPVTDGLMLQLRSPPAGSGSFTTTFTAVPGPLLVTTMSKPMLSPELTGPTGLAVLAMAMLAHCTSTLAIAGSWPALVAAPVAVLAGAVAHRPPLSRAGGGGAVDGLAGLGAHVAEAAGQGLGAHGAAAPPAGHRRADAPVQVQPRRQGVAHRHRVRGPRTGVAHGDVEADAVTGAHRTHRVGGLGDRQVRALDGEARRRRRGAVVARGAGRGVAHRGAVLLGGRRGAVDGRLAGHPEGAREGA